MRRGRGGASRLAAFICLNLGVSGHQGPALGVGWGRRGSKRLSAASPAWGHPEAAFPGGRRGAGAGPGGVADLSLYPTPQKMQESGIDNLMKSLDKNSDQEIDFKEYAVFLTTLCMAYNDFFLEDNK